MSGCQFFSSSSMRDAKSLTAEVMTQADELIWLLEDTPFFLAGRISQPSNGTAKLFHHLSIKL